LLARSQERLALISSIRTLGFWSWNATTDRVWVSKHARRIFGLDERIALTRRMLLAAVHPSDRANALEAIRAATSPGDIVEMELRVLCARSEIRWIAVRASVYRDVKSALLRVAGYVLDDGPRRQAEAASVRQQQQITHLTRVAMLGELSGALAHELQQPLTAILCNAQAGQLLAAKPQVNVEELRAIFKDIENDDKHAGQIIQHLRSLLKRGEMQFEQLQIGDLLGDVLRLARSTLTERHVKIDIDVDEGIYKVRGDRVELQQVLLNLMLNACEAMSVNAQSDRRIGVIVALGHDRSTVRTTVLDTGSGIDNDQLERIFDPFVTTKDRGLGLGLAVCRSIIVAHKGRLWATNRPEGGAAIHFTLPVSTGEAQQ